MSFCFDYSHENDVGQVRSFAKEKAACDKYQTAVNGVLKYGLKSAAASGFFFGTNFTFATGKLILE